MFTLLFTSGTVTCANHFDAWAAKNMMMGDMYEVSLLVEGYQSSGNADVKMSMTSGSTAISANPSTDRSKTAHSGAYGASGHKVVTGGTQTLTFITHRNCCISPKIYNFIGQKIASLPGKEYSAGQHSVTFKASKLPQGVYFYTLKNAD